MSTTLLTPSASGPRARVLVVLAATLFAEGGMASGAAATSPPDCAIAPSNTFLAPQGGGQLSGFGRAVAIRGDWIAVGAPGSPSHPGRVDLYRRTGDSWVDAGVLHAPASIENDGFGAALSLHGSRLLVGAPSAFGAAASSGAAFVYRLDGDKWTFEAQLVSEDGQPFDQFGEDVDLDVTGDADLALIGASGQDHGGSFSGAAYLFQREGDRWSALAKLVAPDPASADFFGRAVELSDGIAAIGAWGDTDGEVNLAGSVRIFEDGPTGWTQTAVFERATSPFASHWRAVGRQLSLESGVLLTNLRQTSDANGALMEFRRQDGAWLGPRLVIAPGSHHTGPSSVALHPDGHIALWTLADSPPTGAIGAAVLRRDAAGWFRNQVVEEPDALPGSWLPGAVACDGSTMVVGKSNSIDGVHGVVLVSDMPPPDRDMDGLDDACEIAQGLDQECDGDGVLDHLQRPFRSTVDNMESSGLLPIALTGGGLGPEVDALVLNHFAVASAHDSQVHSIGFVVPNLAPFGGPHPPLTEAIAVVYRDPDGDGNPVNAILLSAQMVTLPSQGQWTEVVNFPIRPVEVGPPGTSYFAGFMLSIKSGQIFTAVDNVLPHRHAGWVAVSVPPLVLDDLSMNPPIPMELAQPNGVSAWALPIRVNASDCDQSGVLDACEIAEGLLADQDGDFVPDICDPAEADLDGDGSIDGADIGLLLGAWGLCPPGPLDCLFDLTGDGIIDGADLLVLFEAWG
jgi:hypothetical protein